MRTIAVLNQKGGVGKTTTTVNTAAALATLGKRVVVIDLDPQAHLTIHLGVEPQTIQAGAYEVLTQSAEFEQSLMLIRPNLWLLGANINLVGAETELVSVVGREIILREAMAVCQDKFDYCLIDCAPSLGLLSLNALAASQEVLIPLQPHFLALQGFGKLLQTVDLVNKRINRDLKVSGVVLCMFDTRASLPNEVRADIERFLANARGSDCAWADAQLVPTFIRRNIKLAESPSYGRTIFEYDPACNGAMDYRNVARFFLGLEPLTDAEQQAQIEAKRQAEAQRQAALQEAQSEVEAGQTNEVVVEPQTEDAQGTPELVDEAELTIDPEMIVETSSEDSHDEVVENLDVTPEPSGQESEMPVVEQPIQDFQDVNATEAQAELETVSEVEVQTQPETSCHDVEPAPSEEISSSPKPWDLDRTMQLSPGRGPVSGSAGRYEDKPIASQEEIAPSSVSLDEPNPMTQEETPAVSLEADSDAAPINQDDPSGDHLYPEQPPIQIHTIHLPSPQTYSPRPFHDDPTPLPYRPQADSGQRGNETE